jgi:hypothetical protein
MRCASTTGLLNDLYSTLRTLSLLWPSYYHQQPKAQTSKKWTYFPRVVVITWITELRILVGYKVKLQQKKAVDARKPEAQERGVAHL